MGRWVQHIHVGHCSNITKFFFFYEKQSQRQVKGKSQISNLYFMSHDTCLATHLCLKDRKEKEIRVFTCYVAVQLLLGTAPFNFSIKLSRSYVNQIDIL